MRTATSTLIGLAFTLPTLGVAASSARADTDPLSGIDLVTITHANNAPWPGGPGQMANNAGRGSVPYEYRIGRFEVTTAQWAEFYTAAYNRPQSQWIPHLPEPTYWGAAPTTQGAVPGGKRYVVLAGQGMRAVGNVTWRMAAIYANWLHNGKSLDRSAFLSGAYDVSTFGTVGVTFTDQATRSPEARYFIPTLDEWLKAAHYDPHRYGPGQEGWWHYSHTSDTFAIPGAPGQITPGGPAQANYGNYDAVGDVSQYLLGSYASVTSPWGLYDTAGMTTEWTEEIRFGTTGRNFRFADGSHWFTGVGSSDAVWHLGAGDTPNLNLYYFGFRIAAVVPSPGTWLLACVVLCVPLGTRRSRCASSLSSPRPR